MLLDLDNIVKFSDSLDNEYVGTVVFVDDPLKLGRVKCTIENLMNFDVSDLPFIQSKMSTPYFAIPPKVGDKLRVVFRNNDIYHPEYIGYSNSTVNHNADFDDPKSLGISREGFKIRYNTDSELLEVITPNGNKMLMKKTGDIMFVAKKDFVVQADGKLDMNLTGDASIVSQAMATFAGKGGTTLGDSSSITQVLGTSILLGVTGLPIVVLLCQTVGIGNLGGPVFSLTIEGSSIAMAQK